MRRRMPQATYPEVTRTACHSLANTSLFGLAPSGVYPATFVTKCAVRSYRTISPLPISTEMETGGIFSAALSVGSRRPGVTWHSARWSPDFPPLVIRQKAIA